MSAFKRINHTLKCIWHEFVIRINKKNYLSGGNTKARIPRRREAAVLLIDQDESRVKLFVDGEDVP